MMFSSHSSLSCPGQGYQKHGPDISYRKQFWFWSVAWGDCSPWVWHHKEKDNHLTPGRFWSVLSVIWLLTEEAYLAWSLWLWVILQSECPSVQHHAPLPTLLTSPVSYVILCIWMLKSVCTLELMSILDMINVILVAPLRSSTRVSFYCLLSQRLQSLFLPSVHGIKTCEITEIYIGRFGSSFIFYLDCQM